MGDEGVCALRDPSPQCVGSGGGSLSPALSEATVMGYEAKVAAVEVCPLPEAGPIRVPAREGVGADKDS